MLKQDLIKELVRSLDFANVELNRLTDNSDNSDMNYEIKLARILDVIESIILLNSKLDLVNRIFVNKDEENKDEANKEPATV